MEFTTADVKKLREETGATPIDCKNALIEAKTWDDAVKFLEARRDKKAEKMITANRETREGGVFSYVHHNHSVGVLLELNCTTDFVARSEGFRRLASELTLQIAGMAPKYINYEDVPAEVIEAEKNKILEDPSMARVAEDKRALAVEGKLKKALSSEVLMMQQWVKDDTITISELVRKFIAESGENIVVRRFSRFKLSE